MRAVLFVVIALFALIAAGWVVGRLGLINRRWAQLLNRFVARLALPLLLFDALAHTPTDSNLPPLFIIVYGLSMLVTYVIGMVVSRATAGAPLGHMSMHGLTASFGNTGYMGVPLGLAAFGAGGGEPGALATALGLAVTVTISVILIELSRLEHRVWYRIIAGALRAVVLNPIVLAVVVGILCSARGWQPPPLVQLPVTWVAAAAAPCALVGLGLFLATLERPRFDREIGWALVGKVLLQPAIAAALVLGVGGMGTVWGHAAILMAALPTASSVFLVAQTYDTFVEGVSSTIMASTILSMITVSALLLLLQ